jgi:hypothetical protein
MQNKELLDLSHQILELTKAVHASDGRKRSWALSAIVLSKRSPWVERHHHLVHRRNVGGDRRGEAGALMSAARLVIRDARTPLHRERERRHRSLNGCSETIRLGQGAQLLHKCGTPLGGGGGKESPCAGWQCSLR